MRLHQVPVLGKLLTGASNLLHHFLHAGSRQVLTPDSKKMELCRGIEKSIDAPMVRQQQREERRRLVRNRWQLLLMLHSNGQLRQHRGHVRDLKQRKLSFWARQQKNKEEEEEEEEEAQPMRKHTPRALLTALRKRKPAFWARQQNDTEKEEAQSMRKHAPSLVTGLKQRKLPFWARQQKNEPPPPPAANRHPLVYGQPTL